MSKKPAASAYIVALALRDEYREIEAEKEIITKSNEARRLYAERIDFLCVDSDYDQISDEVGLYWAGVTRRLKSLKKSREWLPYIIDGDYSAIIYDALKQPVNKVRKSEGFKQLVPVLETIRRYESCDGRHPMALEEDEVRDLADLIWQQELAKFPNGVDPINKYVITQKVSKELEEVNAVYMGEEILRVEFNDKMLNEYEAAHRDDLALLKQSVNNVFSLFGYDPKATKEENGRNVKQTMTMIDSILGRKNNEERFNQVWVSLLVYFEQLEEFLE